jgi:hypothetical protein
VYANQDTLLEFNHWTYGYKNIDMAPDIPTIHADSGARPLGLKKVVAVPDSELKRWRRTFDANAIVIEGEK